MAARSFSAALLLAGAAAWAQPAPPLTVCMAGDNPPLSHAQGGGVRGLDMRIARAAAAAMGRELVVVPFESDYEKETTLALEVNALLSSGVCDVASGFPLLVTDFKPPGRPTARVPDHPGAPRRRDRPFVPLGTLLPGRAYQAAALGAAMRAPAANWSTLAELKAQPALRVATVAGTMAGALAMGWRFGGLRPQLVSLGQRESALDAVAEGRVDVALVPVAQFDGWRLAHATDPALELAAWRLPVGVNLGFVTLVGREALRDAFDAVIAQALGDGALARWAADEGATFLPPQAPELSVGPSLMLMMTSAP